MMARKLTLRLVEKRRWDYLADILVEIQLSVWAGTLGTRLVRASLFGCPRGLISR